MKTIAIITGASSGIGKEFALRVAKEYQIDEIWAIARGEDRLRALQAGVPVKAIPLDLTAPASVDALSALLREEKPNVKILCNASGYGKFESFENVSEEDNLGMLDLNCRALTQITYRVLPFMTEGGIVVNIASVAAFQPVPYGNVYAATKSYVLSFTRSLGRELKSRKIKTLAVCPYWTKTAFFDRANRQSVITRFDCMYEPSFIIKKTFRAMKKKKKDFVVPGAVAKLTVFATKLLPHKLVMSVFLRQQKLHKK
ncbi:MAG: SDR family NAD(P)-dependent oxidoreductase [Clostridia bacterium]|nr:SDR family NAD(P)-dependent oxidoreductase [Clostridia bacterium]